MAVAGISAGAWSCLDFAIRHSDRCRALILLVPANALPPGVSIRGGALARAIFNSDFIAWFFLKLTPLLPDLLAEVMLGTDPLVLRTAEPARSARQRNSGPSAAGEPPHRRHGVRHSDGGIAAAAGDRGSITCPVLAISAEDDTFGTALRARDIVSRMRNGRTIVFPTRRTRTHRPPGRGAARGYVFSARLGAGGARALTANENGGTMAAVLMPPQSGCR